MTFFRLVVSALISMFLSACETIPPNTIEIRLDSVPSSAAIFSGSGRMLGITPFAYRHPLSREVIAAGRLRLDNATAVWNSGAKASFNLDFGLGGLTSGYVNATIPRPADVAGVMQDVKFAEERARLKSTSDSQAGWAALNEVLVERNRQRSSLPPITDPLASPRVGGTSINCVTQRVGANQIETICR